MIAVVPAARPSRPSIRLTALVTPTIQNTVTRNASPLLSITLACALGVAEPRKLLMNVILMPARYMSIAMAV